MPRQPSSFSDSDLQALIAPNGRIKATQLTRLLPAISGQQGYLTDFRDNLKAISEQAERGQLTPHRHQQLRVIAAELLQRVAVSFSGELNEAIAEAVALEMHQQKNSGGLGDIRWEP